MKRIFAVLGLTALLVSGCRAGAQQPPSPTTYTCPPAVLGGTAYTEVNAPASTTVAASITGSAFTWTPPAAGAYCFTVQTWALPAGATVYQTSVPSNVVQLTIPSGDLAGLSWTPPAPNSAFGPYSYIISYALATPSSVPTAPTQAAPSAVARLGPAPPQTDKKLASPETLAANLRPAHR